jgi:glycosyltransferase involved in cell wall biosynthesis
MVPMISCVIPVYNGKLRLERAIKSALAQRPDVQVVLVDDCSTDDSRELCLKMARDDQRILALSLSDNRGQGYARNVGVAASYAPYVTFLDQDDEHAPGWYDHAIEVLQEDPRFAAVRGEIQLMEIPADLTVSPSDPRRSMMFNSTVWNMVMHKVVYQVLGGCPYSPAFRTRQGAEDACLVVSLKQHFEVAKTTQLASRHYVNANGATAYFFRRTRVVGNRIEFTEMTEEERNGTLEKAFSEFQIAASANVRALRRTLKPERKGVRDFFARISAELLRKLSGS